MRAYEGLKEEYYLADFEPDESVPAQLGLDRARPIVVVRTPPEVSLYHRFENDLFARVLGTGMTAEQFTDLIGRGCAKVNISTALKIAFMRSGYDYMSEHSGEFDPPSIMKVQRAAVMEMAKDHIRKFGSEGRAA